MNLPASNLSIAYVADLTIKLVPTGCPYCRRELRAQDIELLNNRDVRLFCGGCHADMFLMERR